MFIILETIAYLSPEEADVLRRSIAMFPPRRQAGSAVSGARDPRTARAGAKGVAAAIVLRIPMTQCTGPVRCGGYSDQSSTTVKSVNSGAPSKISIIVALDASNPSCRRGSALALPSCFLALEDNEHE